MSDKIIPFRRKEPVSAESQPPIAPPREDSDTEKDWTIVQIVAKAPPPSR